MLEGYALHQILQIAIACFLFLLGWAVTVVGVRYILSRDMKTAVQRTSLRSAEVTQKAFIDVNLAPSLESASQFVEAINGLIRTAVGVGAFLCLTGVALCVVAFLMLAGIAP
ncbi:MAG: hypothetical protein M5R40_22490 [Anaerolineae bacterium]|nr:hypothetical protein [Anaerolineae bacterium]